MKIIELTWEDVIARIEYVKEKIKLNQILKYMVFLRME